MTERASRSRTAPRKSRAATTRWDALRKDRRIRTTRDLPAAHDISRVDELFEAPLPDFWVTWVTECGGLTGYGRSLLGLTRHDVGRRDEIADALDVLLLLRLTEPAFPRDLLPIEILPDRQLSCVVIDGNRNAPVVMVDLDRPEIRVTAALDLAEFVYGWRDDLHAMETIVNEVVAVGDGDETRLLRPDEWSTRRLCSQNVIVALLQTRHNRETNESDVALFASATLTSFAEGAPVRWALTTILTESYLAGGSLAVNFVRRERQGQGLHRDRILPTGRRIPAAIVRWARDHGVRLDGRETRWDHDTGEALLVAAANLPDSLRSLLTTAAVSRGAVCAAVATGTWPALDVEVVLRWAQTPARVLSGSVEAADRLRYIADQQVVRSAIMLSSVHRYLQRCGQMSASLDDDTSRAIRIEIASTSDIGHDSTLSRVRFSALDGEALRLDWPTLSVPLIPRPDLDVYVLAVDVDLLEGMGPPTAATLPANSVLLVPADARARAHALGVLIEVAMKVGVVVVAGPDYTTSMDVEIAGRLDRSRMSRQ